MGKERRQLDRRHMLFYSRVFDRRTGIFLGYLGNLTKEGMMIISEDPIPVGKDFLLRIDLPDDMYEQNVLNFEASSRWCQPDIDPNFHNTGFQFERIEDNDVEVVAQIIEDYGFHN